MNPFSDDELPFIPGDILTPGDYFDELDLTPELPATEDNFDEGFLQTCLPNDSRGTDVTSVEGQAYPGHTGEVSYEVEHHAPTPSATGNVLSVTGALNTDTDSAEAYDDPHSPQAAALHAEAYSRDAITRDCRESSEGRSSQQSYDDFYASGKHMPSALHPDKAQATNPQEVHTPHLFPGQQAQYEQSDSFVEPEASEQDGGDPADKSVSQHGGRAGTVAEQQTPRSSKSSSIPCPSYGRQLGRYEASATTPISLWHPKIWEEEPECHRKPGDGDYTGANFCAWRGQPNGCDGNSSHHQPFEEAAATSTNQASSRKSFQRSQYDTEFQPQHRYPYLTPTAIATLPRSQPATQPQQGLEAHSTASEHPSPQRRPLSSACKQLRSLPQPPSEHLIGDEPPRDGITSLTELYEREVSHAVSSQCRALAAQHELEQQAWDAERHHTSNTEQALREQIQDLKQNQQTLMATAESQRVRLLEFGSKASRFKIFVDGLGNDIDMLKREANTSRLKSNELSEEISERNATRNGILLELSGCLERSNQVKHEAVKAFRDANTALNDALARTFQLEQQIKEKSQLLEDEKKLRLQIQEHLSSVSTAKNAIVRTVTISGENISAKLSQLTAELNTRETDQRVAGLLEAINIAMQGLNSQNIASSDDVSAVSGLVEGLSEAIKNSSARSDSAVSCASSFKTHVDEALQSLRADLCERQTLIERDADHRTIVDTLRERLTANDKALVECRHELASLRASEVKATSENQELHTRLRLLQDQQSAGMERDEHIETMSQQLKSIGAAMETSREDLANKTNELRITNETNATLREEVAGFHRRVDEFSGVSKENATLKQELQQKVQEARDNAKTEWQRDAAQVTADLEAKHANEIAGLRNEQRRAMSANTSAADELSRLKAVLEETRQELEAQASSASTALQEDCEQHRELQSEVARMKVDIESRETANSALNDALNSAKTLLSEQESKAKNVERQMDDQVKQLQSAATEASQKAGKASDELEKERAAHKNLCDDMHKKVEDAERTVRDMRTEHQNTLNQQTENFDDQIKSLRDKIVELETNAQHNDEKGMHREREHEVALAKLKGDHANEIEAYQARAAEIEAHRQEAVAEAKRLREDLNRQKTIMAPPTIPVTDPLGPSSNPARAAAEAVRPRKKVDRRTGASTIVYNTATGADTGAPSITVGRHGGIQQVTHREVLDETGPGRDCASSPLTFRGPVVEESQQVHVPGSEFEEQNFLSPSSPECHSVVPETQEDSCRRAELSPGRGTVVPETQLEFQQETERSPLRPFEAFNEAWKTRGNTPRSLEGASAFKKPMPAPNSGSKLVRSYSEASSQGSQGRTVKADMVNHETTHWEGSSRSSSPAFMSQLANSHASKRMPSGTRAMQQHETSPSKRKAGGRTPGAYGSAKKRRTASMQPDTTPRSSLAPSSSQREYSTRTRTAASARPQRKRPSEDRYAQRFSQELAH